jgi:hypothetical protein
MIPATTLTPTEYSSKFPPGGRGEMSTQTASKTAESGLVSHPILNDNPEVAKSYRLYKIEDLRAHAGDSTYPIPKRDGFEMLPELESLQAVVKEISEGVSVFLHMLVSPKDVLKLFGEDFVKELKKIQSDVNSIFCLADDRSLGREFSKSHLKNTQV